MAKPVRSRRAARNDSALRQAILAATEDLLYERTFDELRVEDILEAAQISRGSFYLYFESRHAVLAELVRNAFGEVTASSWPWVDHEPDRPVRETLVHAVEVGRAMWRKHGPVLRAMVESWRSDPVLTDLWFEIMEGFIARTAERIEEARARGQAPAGRADPQVLAGLLAWMGERVHYLATLGYPRFADEESFMKALAEVWYLAVFGSPP